MTNVVLQGEDPEECLRNETDNIIRKVNISMYTMPLQNVIGSVLPNRIPFKHWGIWAEFEATDVRLGRCVYTIDADVIMPSDDGNSGLGTLLMTLMAGNFVVKVCKFYPNLVRHPYQKFLKKEEEISVEMSPYELAEVANYCAIHAFKSYNVVLNNCQTFAKHLLDQIKQSSQNGAKLIPRKMWTTENIAIAIVSFVTGAAAATVWNAGIMQLDGGSVDKKIIVSLSEGTSSINLCDECGLYHAINI